ncbi:MAG: MFS transporter [Rhodospirillales bacterium]|nr:MFS transporter [Rhodospirillales bacterium]
MPPLESRSSERAEASAFAHREVLAILAGVLLGMFLAALDQTIVATALPTIAGELKGAEHLSWIVAGYLLTSTASTPVYGKLSDLYGRRALFRLAIALFVAASALCALAETMTQLVLARALQGLGGGGLITMAQAVIADVISPRERGRYQAYISGVWAVASVGGPVLGGFFSDYLSWRWIFWINLPLGLAALALAHFSLRRLPRPQARRSVDYSGAMLLVGAVTSLLLVTTWGGVVMPWSSPVILGLALAGVALIALFVLQELRTAEPLLPPRLFVDRVIRVACIASFVSSMAMFGATVFLPVFLQLVMNVSASRSGLLVIPLMAGTVVGAYSAGQVMRATGHYKRLPLAGLSVVTVFFLVLATATATTPPWLAMVSMGALGIGFGLLMPAMLVSVQNAAQPRDIGAATSSIAFFRSLGGSFGVAALWSVLLASLSAALPESSGIGPEVLRGGPEALAGMAPESRAILGEALASAFHVLFLASAALTVVGFLIALRLEERTLRTTPAQARRLGTAAEVPRLNSRVPEESSE